MNIGKSLLLGAAGAALFMLVMSALARAEDCPPNVKSCKVLILTPDEEASLVAPEMILDHAVWANRVKFEGMASAWREKLRQAPAGTVKPAADASANPAKPAAKK